MSEWKEFLGIVKEEREDEILALARKARVPTSVIHALVGAMTVARVHLEHAKEIDGGDVAACAIWEGCDEGASVCPFFDTDADECWMPYQREEDVAAAMAAYTPLYDKMPSKYKRIGVLYVED